MPSILDFYNHQPTKVTKIVDQTLQMLIDSDEGVFAGICPIVDYSDLTFLIMKFSRSKPTIASIVGDEQELPVQRTKAVMFEETLLEARIGKQYVFKNNDFKAMRKLELAMKNKDMPEEYINEFKSIFFGYAADLAPSIVEKVSLLSTIILTKGVVDYNEPLTEARFRLSYDDAITSGVNQLMFTANPIPADAWNSSTTAQGLNQLEQHALSWNRGFGNYPSQLNLRTSLFLDLKAQTTTKQALAVKSGFGATAGDLAGLYVPDQALIDLIKERTKVERVLFFDAMYSEEASLGTVTDKFFLPDDTYFFSVDGNMQRAFIPTPEKDFTKGIYVKARQLDDAPRRERLVGVGAAIPAVFDGRKLAARKVK